MEKVLLILLHSWIQRYVRSSTSFLGFRIEEIRIYGKWGSSSNPKRLDLEKNLDKEYVGSSGLRGQLNPSSGFQ